MHTMAGKVGEIEVIFISNFKFSFVGGGYKSRGWTWKDWEKSGIGVHGVKSPKESIKKLFFKRLTSGGHKAST